MCALIFRYPIRFACGSPPHLGEQNHVHLQVFATFTGSRPRPGTMTKCVESCIRKVAATFATVAPAAA